MTKDLNKLVSIVLGFINFLMILTAPFLGITLFRVTSIVVIQIILIILSQLNNTKHSTQISVFSSILSFLYFMVLEGVTYPLFRFMGDFLNSGIIGPSIVIIIFFGSLSSVILLVWNSVFMPTKVLNS